MSKKIILLGLAAVIFSISASAANAADAVGIVDSKKIMFQHPQFDEVTRILLYLNRPLAQNQMEIADKQEDESTRMLLRKHSALLLEFIAMDRAIADKQNADKQDALFEARQQRLDQVKAQLMEVVYKECNEALQSVMGEKKLTAVLEFDAVYYGGTDITEEVIGKMKSNAGK